MMYNCIKPDHGMITDTKSLSDLQIRYNTIITRKHQIENMIVTSWKLYIIKLLVQPILKQQQQQQSLFAK